MRDHHQAIDYGNLGHNLDRSHAFYFQMKLIRTFEEKLLDLFTRNELFGTTHTCLGQEADAVGVLSALDREKDMVWSNHRCHGHFLAYCGQADGLMAEIMGRETGVCGGRGGSQHLHWRNFASSGVQGGFAPAAVGAAFAEKASGAIGCIFMGDGTMGEGAVYEALNLASLWSAPILFVVEDNAIAQTTPRAQSVAGSIAERAAPFGIRTASYEGTDADEIADLARDMADGVRKKGRPAWLHIRTWRMGPHSKGDDTRSPEEIEEARRRDPLALYRSRVKEADRLDALCAAVVETALERARKAPVACG
jgi:TPP-dependent pyruvate/acetoin dehydrogenase alpha subunit